MSRPMRRNTSKLLIGAVMIFALAVSVGTAAARRGRSPVPSAKSQVAHWLSSLKWRHTHVRCRSAVSKGHGRAWLCDWTGHIASQPRNVTCRGAFRVRHSGHRWTLRSLGAICPRAPVAVAKPARKLPPTTPAPFPSVKSAAGFGFNDNAAGGGLLTPEQDVKLESQAGATVERVTFDWRWAEAKQGIYNFSLYDRLDAAMRAKGIRPIWILLWAPSWASAAPCDQYLQNCLYPPSAQHYGDAAQMAARLATRYPDSAGIEIWNEPNLHWFWLTGPDPVAYSRLLATSYAAVKKANPQMPVVLGGLSNVEASSGGDIAIGDFLSAVYRQGGAGTMDAIGFHPYPAPDVALTRTVVAQVRAVRHRFDDDAKPLWATEIGLTTSSSWWRVSDRQQAATLIQIYRELSAMPDVRMIVFHTLVESGSSSDSEFGYGIVTPDLKPRPAFCAFAAIRNSGFTCGG